MNYHHLKYFQLAAQEENLTRAAEKAHLSQQALSASIVSLEKELDIKLFDRVGRKVVLNQNGKIVLSHIDSILKEYSFMFSELRQYNDSYKKSLYIASTSTHVCQNLLSDFFAYNDDISLNVSYIDSDQLKYTVIQNTTDFIFSSEPVDSSETKSTFLFNERMYLVVSASHPLASRKTLHLTELKDCLFALSMPQNTFRKQFESVCEKAGFKPNVLLESNMEDTISFAILKNMTVTVTVHTALNSPYYSNEHCKIIPIVDDFAVRPIYLISNQKRKASKHWKRFFDFATQYTFDSK